MTGIPQTHLHGETLTREELLRIRAELEDNPRAQPGAHAPRRGENK